MDRSTRFSKLWFVYVLIYMVHFALLEVLPIRNFLSEHVGFLYTGIGVLGAALLAYDFVTRRRMFQVQRADLLVLFFLASLISVLINYQYDLFGNIKALMWMAVQVFLLCAFDSETSWQTHVKRMCLIFDIFIFVWLLAVLWALGMYVIQYGGLMETVRMNIEKPLPIGFVDGRLHGMFEDPNYACISSTFAIGFAVFCWRWGNRPKWFRVYYGFTMAMQIFYIILSGSRMGLLAAMIAISLGVGFLAVIKLRRNVAIKAVSFVLAAVLSAAVINGGYELLRTGLSYVPYLTEEVTHGAFLPEGTDWEEFTEEEEDGMLAVDLSREDLEGKDDFSNNRFKIWSDYLKVLSSTPLFGTSPRGYLMYAEDHFGDLYVVQKNYSTHNGLLLLFLGAGIVGGALMLIWAVKTVIAIVGYLVRRRDSRDANYWMVYLLTMLVTVAAISAMSGQGVFFCNLIQDILFWLVLGFVLYLVRQGEPERNSKPSFVGRACDSVARRLPFGKKGT